MDAVCKTIAEIYDADLKQRLQFCWDDLELLDRGLQLIQDRINQGAELPLDTEQVVRISNLIFQISLKVDYLTLSRELVRLT